jgi:hypothetical protein
MAFYDDMATTVTELLTEFGVAITLTRTDGVFDPVAAKTTSASDADVATIGVWQTIRATLVDGSRIRAGDKFLVIDASQAPRMSDKIAGWSIVEINEINPAGTVLAYRLQVRK